MFSLKMLWYAQISQAKMSIKRVRLKIFVLLMSVILGISLTGCIGYRMDLEHFNTLYYEESPKKAYEYSKQFTKKKRTLFYGTCKTAWALYTPEITRLL